MAELQPLTKLQTLEIMIVETKNELTKCEIMEKLFMRASLRGSVNKNEQMMGMNQQKIRSFKASLVDLEDMHKEQLAESEKDKA